MQISSIGNIFINKTLPAKNYASIPLAFMGNPTGDSFEKSSSSNEGTLSQIKKDIVAQERLIEKLSRDKAEKRTLYNEAYRVYSDAIDRVSAMRRGEIPSDSDDIAEAHKLASKKGSEFDKSRKELNKSNRQYDSAIKRLNELNAYFEAYKKDSSTAFLFNPDIPISKRRELAIKNQIYTLKELPDTLGVAKSTVDGWCRSGAVDILELGEKSDDKFIPVKSKANAEFFDTLISRKNDFYTPERLINEYNVPEGRLKSQIEKGELRSYGYKGALPSGIGYLSALIDTKDELNVKKLEEYDKLYPKASLYLRSDKVPANLLQKTGFANVNTVKRLIAEGHIKGNIERIETKEGTKTRTTVDITSNDTKNALFYLRANNPDTISDSALIRNSSATRAVVDEAILNGELEIVPEYLFVEDFSKRFFDRRNPKNAEFIDKLLFEAKIKEELQPKKAASRKKDRDYSGVNKYQSLRMALAWNYCPKTRQVASNLAQDDQYLRILLEKDNNGEELTTKEQIKVNSYRKQMWQQAGSDEFKAALLRANEILTAYFESGIDSVNDDSAKEILKNYEGV